MVYVTGTVQYNLNNYVSYNYDRQRPAHIFDGQPPNYMTTTGLRRPGMLAVDGQHKNRQFLTAAGRPQLAAATLPTTCGDDLVDTKAFKRIFASLIVRALCLIGT